MNGPPDLLRTIWTQPRPTMRWVQDHGDRGLWRWLLAAELATAAAPIVVPAGVLLPDRANLVPGGGHLGFFALLGLVASCVGFAALVAFGRILAGRRSVRDVLRAVAWGLAPVAAALPFSVLFVAGNPSLPGLVCQLVVAGSALWGFVLVAFTLAEAYEVPTERGVTILLGAATVGVIFAFATLFGLMYMAVSGD